MHFFQLTSGIYLEVPTNTSRRRYQSFLDSILFDELKGSPYMSTLSAYCEGATLSMNLIDTKLLANPYKHIHRMTYKIVKTIEQVDWLEFCL